MKYYHKLRASQQSSAARSCGRRQGAGVRVEHKPCCNLSYKQTEQLAWNSLLELIPSTNKMIEDMGRAVSVYTLTVGGAVVRYRALMPRPGGAVMLGDRCPVRSGRPVNTCRYIVPEDGRSKPDFYWKCLSHFTAQGTPPPLTGEPPEPTTDTVYCRLFDGRVGMN